MSENIKNAAAESAQNAAGAAEAVTHDMTAEAVNEPVQADAGVYTHTFKKPFEYAGVSIHIPREGGDFAMSLATSPM